MAAFAFGRFEGLVAGCCAGIPTTGGCGWKAGATPCGCAAGGAKAAGGANAGGGAKAGGVATAGCATGVSATGATGARGAGAAGWAAGWVSAGAGSSFALLAFGVVLLLLKNPVAKNANVMPNAAPATNHAKRPTFAAVDGASCPPTGCAADGATYEEALANAKVVIIEWIETSQELGRKVLATDKTPMKHR